jgi:hypothetical protein
MSVIVGKAFRCKDGVVRWVVHRSKRGRLHLRWLDEENQIWHFGSTISEEQFKVQIQHETLAPQPGDVFYLCGILGVVSKERVPS